MRKLLLTRFLPILAITLLALFIDLPEKFEIAGKTYTKIQTPLPSKLVEGLDLVGGAHLVFEADASKISKENHDAAIESLREVIARRVNLFGFSEPNIQITKFNNKDRVVVELPGVKSIDEAISVVGKTAQLNFAEVIDAKNSPSPLPTPSQVLNPTGLTGADLTSAKVNFDSVSGKPVVALTFTKEGAGKFAKITAKNVGKPLPIVLDNQVISAPVVSAEISNGSAQISGNFSLDDAKKLAIQLNAGALPVPISLVEQRTIGASLGADSVQKSLKAGLVGVGIVMTFLIIVYRRLGIIADIGLLVFGILTIALYKLIPVVLTLPGIAGFLLSVGMAADANILIFERFREEKDKMGNIADALEVSFGRAWNSIRDANVATLITAFVLANPLDWQFLHTSGPVRGFAITLAVGIGIGLFTGIVVSRTLLRIFVARGGSR